MLKTINKTIEYGLYLLVFLLPIQTRWIIKAGESEYGTVSLYGTDILLIVLLFLFAFLYFKMQRGSTVPLRRELWSQQGFQINSKSQISNSKCKVWWLTAGLDLMIFISIFFAEDKMIAVYKYGLFLLGIGLFWLIISASYDKIKLIYCFLAGIFLQAGLGIWQFLTQSSFACKWLGMAEHDAGELGTSVVETISSTDGIGERWLRAYGGLDHPNVLGGLLAVGLLVLAGFIVKNSEFKIKKLEIGNWKFGEDVQCDGSIAAKPCGAEARAVNNDLQRGSTVPLRLELWSQRGKQISNFKFLISGIYFLLLTFTTSLFFTFSRGAWLGLIIGVVAVLAITVVKKNLLAQKKLLEIILISSALIFILFSQFQDLVLTRLSNSARLEIKSNTERIDSYKDSWGMIKDNWLFGVGIGNYIVESKKLEVRSKNYNKQGYFYQPVHNVFLLVWAEIGIFGLLFFIVLLLCVMRQLCRQPLCVMRYALCAAIAAMFTIDHWWWSLHFGVLLFWLILGYIIRGETIVDKNLKSAR